MILISAGHHPKAKGAECNGVFEHDEALAWVAELTSLLGGLSLAVPPGPLAAKTAFINANRPTLAVEVHFNSLDAKRTLPAERGCLTLYAPGSTHGRVLAQACHDAYKHLFPPDLGVREGYYRLDPALGADWFLVRTTCPAVILEPEFIDRYAEIRTKRRAACEALAKVLDTAYRQYHYMI